MIEKRTPEIKPTLQKPAYKYIGEESLIENIKKSIPKELTPTKRVGSIFGGIFLLVIIIATSQFPFSSLLTGNTDIIVKIGYPMTFLEFKLTETDTSPLRPIALTLDIFIYMIIAYLIDIILNVIFNITILQSKEETKQRPTVFKDRKPTMAEKMAEKMAKNKLHK